MAVEIVYETHATTTDNQNGIATGHLPGRLSDLGHRQAWELGERRRADGLAAVFTSDRHRAVETARIAFPDGRPRFTRTPDCGSATTAISAKAAPSSSPRGAPGTSTSRSPTARATARC
ncbi:histidine phosphatase family protein [Nonomuraea sp. 3N208]|uniref:histidine phosphatase family protein n=1 Tax=Nonomuraea sp. 3N208 TaxID=3457421 RepID=UPI003FD2A169